MSMVSECCSRFSSQAQYLSQVLQSLESGPGEALQSDALLLESFPLLLSLIPSQIPLLRI